jgi:hypothetical protein
MIEDSDEKDIDLKVFFCTWWNPWYDVQVYREGLNYGIIFPLTIKYCKIWIFYEKRIVEYLKNLLKNWHENIRGLWEFVEFFFSNFV